MADYTLYYWPLPFRGQFVRAVLAHAGATWDEPGTKDLAALKAAPVADQPVPFMAPPMLVDHGAGVALAQMPAILAYLGDKFGLIPSDPVKAALTHKLIADANDVLDGITRNGGQMMWDRDAWQAFIGARLPRWMQIFEELGLRHGLAADRGHLLGTEQPGLADLVSAILWVTMADKLPQVGEVLQDSAPGLAAHSDRIAKLPAISAMRADTDARFGDIYCGGQIEASIREMLG